jgi:isoleucyl-tRNA synthetase
VEAVALHPELDYVLVDTGNEYLLLAQALAENALSRYDIQGATIGEKTFSIPAYQRQTVCCQSKWI